MLLIGVEHERLERALKILHDNLVTVRESKKRKAKPFFLNIEEFIQA